MTTAKKISADVKPEALYKGLEFIESPEDRKRLLAQAAEHHWECLVQIRGVEEKFNAVVSSQNVDGFRVKLSDEARFRVFEKLRAQQVNSGAKTECLILVYSKKTIFKRDSDYL